MDYGDEFYIEVPAGFDPSLFSHTELDKLFEQASPVNKFNTAPNRSFFQQTLPGGIRGLMAFKINNDCMIEINDSLLRTPALLRNQVSDIISFQFVLSVKRSEFHGERKNVHDLGPAIIVSVIPNKETTYRLPAINQPIRHVIVHTSLSNLLDRMGECKDDYPLWLQEILNGEHDKPRQRVLFLDDMHRDLIWSCFHLPVSGTLLAYWMAAKFQELLCTGLQILKHNQIVNEHHSDEHAFHNSSKISMGRAILNREYAHPPSLQALAKQLGISETQLKSGFKSMNGTTVLQYCINRRIEAAKLLLDENRHSISEISDIVGYDDHSAFSRAFRRLSGCTPRQWRLLQDK